MIEKIQGKIIKFGNTEAIEMTAAEAKINELIDAVNRLEKHLSEITNATAEITPSK